MRIRGSRRSTGGSEPGTWLERVLGPAAPQLSCDDCFVELDRYVELELAGGHATSAVPGMEPHLDGCPACREEHDDLLAFLRSH